MKLSTKHFGIYLKAKELRGNKVVPAALKNLKMVKKTMHALKCSYSKP